MAQQQLSEEEIDVQRQKYAYEKNTIPELVYYYKDSKFLSLEEVFRPVSMPTSDGLAKVFKVYKALVKQQTTLDKKDFGLYYTMFASVGLSEMEMNYWYIPLIDFIYDNRIDMKYPESVTRSSINDFMAKGKVDDARREYEKKRMEFRMKMEMQKNKKESLSQLPYVFQMTERTIVRLFRTYPCDKSVYDVSEFFNMAKVTHTFPYLNLGEFYKIHNDVEIYPSWVEQESSPEQIIGYIKTDSSIVPKEASYDLFILGADTLTVNSTEKERFSAKSGNRAIEKIQKLFMDKISIPKVEDNGDDVPYKVLKEDLRIECFYLNTNIHPLVFKYFLYTDPVIRNFFFLDERIKVSRKKNYLYIFYYPNPEEDDSHPITINLSNVFADEIMSKQKNIPVNRCHVRAYISYATSETIESVLLDLNRCLTLFETKRDILHRELEGIVDRKKLDEEWVNECRIGKVYEKKEVEINFGDLYSDYSRAAGIHPAILERIVKEDYYVVNPGETENPEYWVGQRPYEKGDDRVQAIWFPSKKDKERLEGGGMQVNSYYFVANNKKQPFIGLTPRPELDPPFSPNTFKDNQLDKQNSPLVKYLSGQIVDETSSPYILKTGKHVKYEKFGKMSPMVDKWMEMVYPGHELIRYGIFDYEKEIHEERKIVKGKRSSNILYVLEYLIHGKKTNDPLFRRLRLSIQKYINQTNMYCTETFKYSKEELIDIIIDEDKWFDPLLFYHILRDMYQVELVFFTKREEKSKSEFYLTCPYFYHESMAEEYVPYKEFIIITINNGGEFDRHDYPHCEPTFIYSEITDGGAIKPSFNVGLDTFKNPTDSAFYRTIRMALSELYGKKSAIPHFRENPVSQTLDTLGRVSWLHFSGVSVHMLTPIHSQNMGVREGVTFTNEENMVEQFMRQQNMNGRVRKIVDKKIGYDVWYQGFRFFIPIGVQEEESALNMYHKYEKVARYVTEYVYYLFSHYAKGKEITPQNIKEHYVYFSHHHMIVKEDVMYPLSGRLFYVENHPYLVRNDKLDFPWQLMIKGELMRRKCMYLLRQFYDSYPEILLLYHELKYMPNYYRTVLDFIPHSRTIFFQQKSNVESYVKNMNKELSEGVLSIQPMEENSYIMYRMIPEFGHSVWLMKPARSLKHAVYLCEEWYRHRVVKQDMGESSEPCTKIVWETSTSYQIYVEPEGEQRLVCMIRTEEGMKYQACCKYDASYAK